MRTVKTSELIGAALDWAVARADPDFTYKLSKHVEWLDDEYWVMCDDGVIRHHDEDQSWNGRNRHYDTTDWSPSTNPEQGQPIMEKEGISSQFESGFGIFMGEQQSEPRWLCRAKGRVVNELGSTMLIAGMRAFVASRLGEEVEVPEELA